ncbi:MAG: protein kinase domain-containing protein, partial [Polyangiaceae bacterium]
MAVAPAARPELPAWTCLERVGSGASAEVWRAHNPRGEVAAIKIAKPEMADVVRAEARMLRDLSRRWGARLVGEGETSSGEFFFATEWLEGEKLEPTSIATRDRARTAAVVAHAVGRALAELHDAGLRHGDVKPDNIVMHSAPRQDRARDRGASLIDLGLATSHETSARGGTARYASPELRANAESVGPASDSF